MSMMTDLFKQVPKIWNKDSKSQSVFTINTTYFTYTTVKDGFMYFHNFIFDEERMGEMLVIDLSLQSLNGLTSVFNQNNINWSNPLGFTSLADVGGKLALVLDEVENLPIATPATLTIYTAINRQVFHPIAIYLKRAKDDLDSFLQQLYLSSASGAWLDYWASFLNVARNLNETDSDFVKRILLNITNPKVNNIAMEEHIAFLTKTKATVVDSTTQNLTYLVNFDFSAVNLDANAISTLMDKIRPVGINYIIGYTSSYTENYQYYYQDKAKIAFSNSDQVQAIALGTGSAFSFMLGSYGFGLGHMTLGSGAIVITNIK